MSHHGTMEIVCPHCDHEFADSWELGEVEDIGEIACGSCGRVFYCRRLIEVTYATETLEERRCRAAHIAREDGYS